MLSFVLLASWVTGRLWWQPSAGLEANRMDPALFEWMLAHGARVVTDFDNPFISGRMNVPNGVNLMGNTSVLGISIPLAPVTLLAGPRVALIVFLTLALIATGTAWYFVLSRFLVGSRVAAWVGALFCAFAPSMVAHTNGHPNIIAQFLVPMIVWRTLRLREPGRWLRNGLLLGAVIVWQAFINLEILFMTAVGLGIFLAVLTVLRRELRREVRSFAAGLSVAAGFAVLLLGYPLYLQFFGPYAYHGLPASVRGYGADLLSFVSFSRGSLAGQPAPAKPLAPNLTEENSFFGWPLAVLVVALVCWLRRTATVLALAAVGAVFALLSLGPEIRLAGHRTGVPGPWAALAGLPVFDSALPTRWALAVAPVIGILLAIGCARAGKLARRYPRAAAPIRFAVVAVLAMALVPLVPLPVRVVRLAPTPRFVTSGAWKPYVAGGRSVVTLPLPESSYPDPLRWSARTGLDMPIARGYFLGPADRPGDRTALFTAPPRPTSRLLADVGRNGRLPAITATQRAEAVEDLRYWRAGVVVLAPRRHDDALRQVMTELTGIQPTRSGGVWLWDARGLAG